MIDAALQALWKQVIDNWDDAGAHAKFLNYCQQTEQLAEAAARYRGMAEDRSRGESAQRQLQAITLLAYSELDRARSVPPPRAPLAAKLLAIVFFLVASALLLVTLWR
jgi:hypothetical protein